MRPTKKGGSMTEQQEQSSVPAPSKIPPALRPFFQALAELLVNDLLRYPPGAPLPEPA